MELNVSKKRLDTGPIQSRLVQGEALVDRPQIVMPRDYEGKDISALNYEIRAVSEKETMVRRPLEKAVEEDRVILTWTVVKEFTAVSGFLDLTIVGVDDAGEEIIKITSDKIIIRPDPDGDWTEPPVDVVQDALNQMMVMQSAAQRARDETEAIRDETKELVTGVAEDIAAATQQVIEEAGGIRDEAKRYAEAAARSAESAADSAEAAEAAKADVAQNAAAAGEAAASAADSRDEAKHYADLALQATGYRGWFATGADLREKYPIGEDGWWAVVGATDTIWVWDSDTGRWKDSGSGSIGSVNAEDVAYDNTKSGLPADNVQDAIDQMDSSITGFVSKTTEFSEDGKTITETFGEREIVTAFVSDTVITQLLFVGGKLSATKTTTFEADGSIKEEIT